MKNAPPDKKKTLRIFATWRGRVLAALLVLALLAGLFLWRWHNGLPHRVWQRLHSAKSVTFYSLYPETIRYPEGDVSGIDGMTWGELLALPRLQGYPVLGQFECSDPGLLQLIADGLSEGTRPWGDGAACFLPRHGLKLTDGDGTLELLICHECHYLYIYEEGKLTSLHVLDMPASSPGRVWWDAECVHRGIRMAKNKP